MDWYVVASTVATLCDKSAGDPHDTGGQSGAGSLQDACSVQTTSNVRPPVQQQKTI